MIASENCARQVRLLRFPLMQKFAKNQFFTALGDLKTLKFLINYCIILKVLERSNFLLLLCSKGKTKNIFTPPYCIYRSKMIYHTFYNYQVALQYEASCAFLNFQIVETFCYTLHCTVVLQYVSCVPF